ncbi:MAG: peptidase M48 [Elusimicrobia bacterium RIFOXYA2_FULL_50_26]|nr:MAG: peptidase M48 [Elusimicrobia bacterium RIFOXYA2_FULL_50_26]OGS23916.1 MAG: peptidase M48 [Elusimicrobia bacterium RIFOXYB2_FULL_50_12]
MYLIIILVILIGVHVLDLVVEMLNVRHASPQLPAEFEGYYDAAKYRSAQQYLKENTVFALVSGGFSLAVLISFIVIGGFNFVDRWARGFGLGEIGTGLIFVGALMLGAAILKIPFSAYHTFVIEEKHGFNRTTPATFALDLLKSYILVAIIGAVALSVVLWFFGAAGKVAWLYSWAAVTLLQLFFEFIAPVVIMPLFNKFVPLQDGELKNELESYARQQQFAMKGVYTMDASRRSAKSNAFFVGFGRYRRIVLFDTLINRHSVEELVSVLAHEMGHYKRGHILKFMAGSVISSGIMFFILSLFMNNAGLFAAFRMEQVSIYASIVFFGFLFTPISTLLAVITNVFSRRYEFESDVYAVKTYKKPDAMIAALKKLSVDNLSNLTPHPLKVFLEYSHPPVLRRIEAIRAQTTA